MLKRGFKRAQISVEYLVVIGFIVFIVISLLGVAFFYTSGIRDRIKANQLSSFANKITSSAESVYYAGEPSKITVTAYLPEGVQSIQVLENSLVFDISMSSGVSRLAFPVDVPIDAGTVISIREGVKRLEVSAGGVEVSVIES